MTDSPQAADYVQAAGYGSAQTPVAITLHATCPESLVAAPPIQTVQPGSARNTASYFATHANASAHYAVDVAEVIQCVPENLQAWHDGDNWQSIGIEICGQASWTREQWLSPDVYPVLERAAALVADIAARRGIPIVHRPDDLRAPGIRTHAEVTALLGLTEGHTDPGQGFPLDVCLALASGDDMPLTDTDVKQIAFAVLNGTPLDGPEGGILASWIKATRKDAGQAKIDAAAARALAEQAAAKASGLTVDQVRQAVADAIAAQVTVTGDLKVVPR